MMCMRDLLSHSAMAQRGVVGCSWLKPYKVTRHRQ